MKKKKKMIGTNHKLRHIRYITNKRNIKMTDERVLRVFYETIERLRKDIKQLSDDELTELKTNLSEWLK